MKQLHTRIKELENNNDSKDKIIDNLQNNIENFNRPSVGVSNNNDDDVVIDYRFSNQSFHKNSNNKNNEECISLVDLASLKNDNDII